MDTTETTTSSAPILTEEEVQHYEQQGYVVPKWKYSTKKYRNDDTIVQNLSKLIDHYQEQLVCPHLPRGATKPMVSKRHLDFLNLAMEEGVKKILGQILAQTCCFGAANYFANPQLSVWKYHGTRMALLADQTISKRFSMDCY